MNYSYQWYFGGDSLPETLLAECSALISRHYGRWSLKAPQKAGLPIQQSTNMIRRLLQTPESKIYCALDEMLLIGYAIVVTLKIPKYGTVSWVTQLIVHEDYRHQNVAKTLLFAAWGVSDHYAWGLATSNPFAVRVLEKATRRRCTPVRIRRNGKKLISIGEENSNISYFKPGIKSLINTLTSQVNTEFFADHSLIEERIQKMTREDQINWLMGDLQEGWEWFAFTFANQPPISLSQDEVSQMLEASDSVTLKAYSEMPMDKQGWTHHTVAEVDWMISTSGLSSQDRVLDMGCGTGRHVLEWAQRGYDCLGVDYIDKFIEEAQLKQKDSVWSHVAKFKHLDCRNFDLKETFDIVTCLYDVIGSFISEKDNMDILHTLVRHLKPGGKAFISVMNYEYTKTIATQVFSLTETPDKLLQLKPGKVMEETGNIFNPDYFMLDERERVVYRKEQFVGHSGNLPSELLVRDRRFTLNEILAMLKKSGLEIIFSRYVLAGKWDQGLKETKGKEILLYCAKPFDSKIIPLEPL